ncbi:MAG: DUF4258 domain-containing protein [Campylobacterota bacterium]|nr:DUF4258 domain-containing protein [Campylobacterota bacterium]
MNKQVSKVDDINSFSIMWKKHALQRMMERSISRASVKTAILNGVIIEQYPDDYPYPSCLIAYINSEPLHAVFSIDYESNILYVITVYVPDEKHFKEDLITRREDDK